MMHLVSKADFFKPIYDNGLDVHPSIVSRFPYTSEWRFHRKLSAPLYGKTVDRLERGMIVTDYFVAESQR